MGKQVPPPTVKPLAIVKRKKRSSDQRPAGPTFWADTASDAYTLLQVTPEQVEDIPKISHLLRGLGDGKSITHRVFEYLSGSEDEDARRLVRSRRLLTTEQAEAVPIEAFCVAAGITSRRLFGLIAQEVVEQEALATALLTRAAHPKVVQATIDSALTMFGDKDRKMLHQEAGFIPVPKNQITINKNNVTNVANVAMLPPIEDVAKKISSRFISEAEPVREIEAAFEPVDEEEENEAEY